jgi:4'-phosphopantetheinyl transferase
VTDSGAPASEIGAAPPAAGATVPPLPGVGTVHVWWARRQDATPELERLLDEPERGRLAAYRRAEDRERFLAACALAKTALGGYLRRDPGSVRLDRTCARCGRPHGKPRLDDEHAPPVELSVTHAGDLVAVAFATGARVGIDVEPLDRRLRPDELARVALAAEEDDELAALEEGERVRAFLVYWTRKEAATKAVGRGIEMPLRRIRVSAPHEPPRLLAWPHEEAPDAVSLVDLEAPAGHVAALAVVGPCEEVVGLDGTALLRPSSEEGGHSLAR